MVGLPDVAKAFQEAGMTVLVYDPRSTGLSDGVPRNDIDPFKQIEDYSDALTFLRAHHMVDPSSLGLWGMSLAGAVALCTASYDKRVKFVIAVCPAVEYQYLETKLPKVLGKITQDRESQVKGNSPFYIPMLNNVGENPAGFNLGMEKEAALRILSARDETISTRTALAPNHVNRTTIQSYHKLLMWNPSYMWRYLEAAAMFVVPEQDQLISAETQQKYFELLPGPKKLHVQHGRGHMNILEGESLPGLMQLQIGFVHNALAGKL
jgi:pimeloyl-ACP methyl ester carboxylesterase